MRNPGDVDRSIPQPVRLIAKAQRNRRATHDRTIAGRIASPAMAICLLAGFIPGYAERQSILDRIGLNAQTIARGIVERVAAEGHEPLPITEKATRD